MTNNNLMNNKTLDGAEARDGGAAAEALSVARKCVVIFGVAGAIVLATLAVIVAAHGSVSTFMWVRAAILLAAAPLLHRMATRAGAGSRRDFDRLRAVSLILPIAIVVVDLIPGVCPAWYAALQGVSALALVAVAIITRRRAVAGALSAGGPQAG